MGALGVFWSLLSSISPLPTDLHMVPSYYPSFNIEENLLVLETYPLACLPGEIELLHLPLVDFILNILSVNLPSLFKNLTILCNLPCVLPILYHLYQYLLQGISTMLIALGIPQSDG